MLCCPLVSGRAYSESPNVRVAGLPQFSYATFALAHPAPLSDNIGQVNSGGFFEVSITHLTQQLWPSKAMA